MLSNLHKTIASICFRQIIISLTYFLVEVDQLAIFFDTTKYHIFSNYSSGLTTEYLANKNVQDMK